MLPPGLWYCWVYIYPLWIEKEKGVKQMSTSAETGFAWGRWSSSLSWPSPSPALPHQRSRIKDQGPSPSPKLPHQGLRIKDQEPSPTPAIPHRRSRIKHQGLRIKDQGPRPSSTLPPQRSRIKDPVPVQHFPLKDHDQPSSSSTPHALFWSPSVPLDSQSHRCQTPPSASFSILPFTLSLLPSARTNWWHTPWVQANCFFLHPTTQCHPSLQVSRPWQFPQLKWLQPFLGMPGRRPGWDWKKKNKS